MNGNKSMYTNKTFWKWLGIVFLAVFAIGIISDMTGYSDKRAEDAEVAEAEQAEQKAAEQMERDAARYQERAEKEAAKRAKVVAEQRALESLTDEQAIAKAARNAFGDTAVKSVTYVDGINIAMIAINEPIEVSANMSRKQFLLAVRDTIKEIADMNGLKGVDVRWKDGDMRLMELRFEGDAVARAADATHVDDLTTIAGTYWAHSGF